MTSNNYNKHRVSRIERLEEHDVEPYPDLGDVEPSSVDEFVSAYEDSTDIDDNIWTLAGRINRQNEFGDFVFYDINDKTAEVQVMCSVDERTDFKTEDYELLQNISIGDRVVFEGKPTFSDTDELTLNAVSWELASASLKDTAGDHSQLNEKNRIEERTAAIMTDQDLYDTIDTRFRIQEQVRAFLTNLDFQEVETPILHNNSGGAEATPFTTYCESLDEEVYLRIAPELYLKRLITAGYSRVFEMSSCFRNESIDTTHNPEFTMLELYQEYANYRDMMDLTESLFSNVSQKITGSQHIKYNNKSIDLSPPWDRKRFDDLVADVFDEDSVDNLNRSTVEHHLSNNHDFADDELEDIESLDGLLMEVFEQDIEPNLEGPVFVTDYPKVSTPLCKTHPINETRVQRFEAFILGMEVGNSYTELTDPREQKRRLIEQSDSEDDINNEFVDALSYGMPPTAGLGIGIDRMVMILTDSQSIKDVVAYPMANRRV